MTTATTNKLQDGTGKPVRFTRDSIRKAVLGDTNYVATVEQWGPTDPRVVMVCDEDADDISLSLKGDHMISFSVSEMEEAIDNFLKLLDW